MEMLVAALSGRLHVAITCVRDARGCLDTEVLDPHDLVIVEMDLPGPSELHAVRDLTALSDRPVILLASLPIRPDAVVEAMRLGVRDVFAKPFAIEDLLDSVHRTLQRHRIQRQQAVRYRRMRDLVRRVIRERRDLDRRVELICRDLVGAHRRLVHRVIEFEESRVRTTR